MCYFLLQFHFRSKGLTCSNSSLDYDGVSSVRLGLGLGLRLVWFGTC